MMNNDFIKNNGTINGMEAFAETVQEAIKIYYEDDVKIMIHDVRKNNDVQLTGLTILNSNSNLSPTIYLEPYYADYKAGKTLSDIYREIIEVYEEHCLKCNFDITMITDFNKVKDNICFKVINAEKNSGLLTNTPHKTILDLAVVFYIEVMQDEAGNGTVLVQNHFLNMWDDIDIDTLYKMALKNTQRKYHGRIASMYTMIAEILDEELHEEFFDIMIEDDVSMYVATNVQKVLGAGVILYDNLLKTFAEHIGSDFYILPSSTHEVLFVPASVGMDAEYLKQMVREVNASEVSEQEFLSNNVYYYSIDDDRMVIA